MERVADDDGDGARRNTGIPPRASESFGTPESYPQYSLGWGHAMDTPYQWTKRVASHWGGTRNGLIVHWPRGIEARGEVRHQFHHVIDVAPTLLEARGCRSLFWSTVSRSSRSKA